MEITKKDIDSLNAVVTVAVKAEDYTDKVQKILNNYRKTANIPGFRKGHVPMGMVKKQYGKAVLVEEVNKILQDALHKYLTEEKLDVLGNPLPKNDTEIDWDAKDFTFDFELGLSPKFDVDVVGKKAITHYNIEADDKMVNDQVTSIRKQYGKLISKKEVEKGDEITGTFSNEEKEINKDTTFSLDVIKGKTQLKKIIGLIGENSEDAISELKNILSKIDVENKKLEFLVKNQIILYLYENKRQIDSFKPILIDLFKNQDWEEIKQKIKKNSILSFEN